MIVKPMPPEADRRSQDIQQSFLSLSEHLPDLIARLDRDGRYCYANSALAGLAGRPAAQMVGHRLGEVLAQRTSPAIPDDFIALREGIPRVFATGETVEREAGLPLPGDERIFNVRLVPERDESGAIVNVLLIGRDITQRKRAEDALRNSERDLNEAQRVAKIGNWRFDLRFNSVTWSAELYRMFGVQAADFARTYEAFLSRIHPDDRVRVAQTSAQTLADGKSFQLEYRIVLPGGEIRTIREIGNAIAGPEGQITGLFGTAQDITESRRGADALRASERRFARAEEQLGQARAELTRVARAMLVGELATSIAHEVNQPLTCVVTNAEAALRWLAADPPNFVQASTALERIIRDGNRAAAVVARIRILLKNGKSTKTRFKLDIAISDLLALMEGEARRRQVELQVRIAPDLPAVIADRVQLQQVLLNLTVNAFDALDNVQDRPRQVEIEAEPVGPASVQVCVRDSGVGLAGPPWDRVFDAFYTTKPDGLGMGLTISRTIIESHGGRLWAQPNQGPGVSFRFTLPIDDQITA